MERRVVQFGCKHWFAARDFLTTPKEHTVRGKALVDILLFFLANAHRSFAVLNIGEPKLLHSGMSNVHEGNSAIACRLESTHYLIPCSPVKDLERFMRRTFFI